MTLRRLAPFLVLFAAPSAAWAAGLQIVPVLVELSRAEPRASVVVRNTGDTPVRLELTVSAWEQRPDGQMRLAPAPEFLVFPPLLEIGPNAERKIRISTTASFGPRELSYRLFIQELPPAEKPKEKNAIRLVTRVGVPVFLAPSKVELAAQITDLKVEAGLVRFVLRNTGTTRLSPGQIRIDGRLADDRPAFSGTVESWYVLSGGERVFDFPIPSGECGRVSRIVIEAPLGDGTVRARVETPGGACGP